MSKPKRDGITISRADARVLIAAAHDAELYRFRLSQECAAVGLGADEAECRRIDTRYERAAEKLRRKLGEG